MTKHFLHHIVWILAAVVLGGGTAFFATKATMIGYAYFQTLKQPVVYNAEKVVDQIFDPASRIKLGATDQKVTLPTTGKVIAANLDKMELTLYQDGKPTQTLPIVSRGRPGSPWETPPGLYKVLSKEENHFSSIGHVWMPYSMQFFGNFFIHGWPYYPDGREVGEGYSGGCIRLKTEDAAKVYAFADRGTAIFITGDEEVLVKPQEVASSTAYYFLNKRAGLPKVNAKGYIVADLDTGEVILERNKDVVLPIASLTKLMTSLVSLETVNQFQVARISPAAVATFGLAGSLKAGDNLTVQDLLYPLLLESSNDAAEVLAEHAGHDRFIRSMNEKADSIGLTDTVFEDPSGLSNHNVSTAQDYFRLAQYIFKYKSYVLDVTKKKQATVDNYTWHNNSKFAYDKNYLGGKNGYTTEAQHTLVALFELPLSEFSKRRIGIVLLHTDNKEEDARNILKYLSANVYYGGEASANATFRRLQEATTTPAVESKPTVLKTDGVTELAFVGDIMLDRGVKKSVETNGAGDYHFIFQHAAPLKDPDIMFANLEGPVSTRGRNVGSIYSFRMDPRTVPILKEVGFDVLSVANNHSGDWTLDAFEDTFRLVTGTGMLAIGGGSTKQKASEVKIIEKNGTRFGFIGFSDVGPNWLAASTNSSGILLASDPNRIQMIKTAAAKVDVLIVSYHFGEEYQKDPSARQIALARESVDAGARLVIGHHPHVIEKVEKYKDGLIAYSLGNFIFDQNFSAETMEGLMLKVQFKGNELAGYQEDKFVINKNYQPVLK